MEPWQISVWTRFSATPDDVWRARTDVSTFGGRWLRLRASDFAALTAAARTGGRATSSGGISGPFGLVRAPATVQVRGGTPLEGWEMTIDCPQLGHADVWNRFQTSIDGHVRHVEEVRFMPSRGGKLAANLLCRALVAEHRAAASLLPTDKNATAVSIVRQAFTPPPDVDPLIDD